VSIEEVVVHLVRLDVAKSEGNTDEKEEGRKEGRKEGRRANTHTLPYLVFPRESYFAIPGKEGMKLSFPGNSRDPGN
jgi:hypothetical protein